MISLKIPGFNESLNLEHLLLDFNGTLAIDGKIINGVKEMLNELSNKVTIHVLTGNTFGTVEEELKDVNCKIVPLPTEQLGKQKEKYIQQLNKDSVVSIGNGRNDRLILQASIIGIIVIQKEGASPETLLSADVICPDIISALELLNNPLRLVATLRN
jgi:soluble P-type ATPase